MNASKKTDLSRVGNTKNLVESLKENSSSQRLMEDKTKIISGVPAPQAGQFTFPDLPKIPTQEEVNKYRSASVFMQAIAEEALLWKDQLPANYKPAILALLYGGVQVQVIYWLRSVFMGYELKGHSTAAHVHYSLINQLFRSSVLVKKKQRNNHEGLLDSSGVIITLKCDFSMPSSSSMGFQ